MSELREAIDATAYALTQAPVQERVRLGGLVLDAARRMADLEDKVAEGARVVVQTPCKACGGYGAVPMPAPEGVGTGFVPEMCPVCRDDPWVDEEVVMPDE